VFLPLRHESMQGRRWPIITIALIAINLLAFLGTYWQIDQEDPQRGEVRAHILLLSASLPELTMTAEVQEMVDAFKRNLQRVTWPTPGTPGYG
jgi:hypothetical protein